MLQRPSFRTATLRGYQPSIRRSVFFLLNAYFVPRGKAAKPLNPQLLPLARFPKAPAFYAVATGDAALLEIPFG